MTHHFSVEPTPRYASTSPGVAHGSDVLMVPSSIPDTDLSFQCVEEYRRVVVIIYGQTRDWNVRPCDVTSELA